MEMETRRKDSLLSPDLVCSLGIATYWSCAATFVYSSTLKTYSDSEWIGLINVVAHFATLMILALLFLRLRPNKSIKAIFFIGVSSVIITAVVMALVLVSGNDGLAIIGTIVEGLGAGLALILWSDSLTRIPVKRLFKVMLIGVVLCLLFNLVVINLTDEASVFASLLLLTASFFCSWQLTRFKPVKQQHISPIMTDTLWKLLLWCFLFAIPMSYLHSRGTGENADSIIYAANFFVACLVVALNEILQKHRFSNILPKTVIILLGGCMVFLPLVYTESAMAVADGVSLLGGLIFRSCLYADLMMISYAADTSKRSSLFALGTAFLDIGVIVGLIARRLVADEFNLTFALIIAYAILLAGLLLPPKLFRRNANESEPTEEAHLDHAVVGQSRMITEKYLLTPREQDVLVKTLEGKKITTIAQELYLSTNTVKTHRRHILQKLNCNSREEVFQLALKEENRSDSNF